jgi:integrase
MGTVFQYRGGWRFKFKDAAGDWRTVDSKAHTKAKARAELHEKELEVERQRLGLAPMSLNPDKLTVADLMNWWLDTYSSHQEAHESNQGTIRNHILSAPLASKLLEHVRAGDIEQLLQSKAGELAPGTINHIRQFFVRAFNKARKADKWHGGNPAEDVETRRVPETVVNILAPEEVFPFFAAIHPSHRPIFAAAIFTGFRKGELCGLRKDDVDLARGLLIARRSYDRPYPKSKKERVVPIPAEFVPFIKYALETAPGNGLFPHSDGSMRPKGWQPEEILRRALKRAGIVTGYTHTCRRKTCRYSEERQDAEVRPCPKCGFKLWPTGKVRHIRFHDLRHTYASVLLMFGANLVSVQKLLGHSDPKITERRYGHMLPSFMRTEVDRLRFGLDQLAPRLAGSSDSGPSQALAGVPQQLGIPVVSAGETGNTEAGTPGFSPGIPASGLAGCRGLEPLSFGVTGRRYNQLN